MTKKHVLVVCQHFWPESFRINDIAEYLLDEGCTVDVLCGRPNYPSGKLLEGYTLWNRRKENYKGATVYRSFEIPRGNNSNIRIFLNYISFPISSLVHIPRLLFNKYDRIFLYQLSPVMMSITGIIISKIKRVETTMYVLDLWPENLYSVLDIKTPVLRKLIESASHWHYRHVDKLIALSESMKEKLINTTGISPEKIIVLPQAPEKLYETPIKDKKLEERFKNTFNVIFTGNISPAQSFSTIIKAAEILKESGVEDVRWIIVGDGMSRKKVELEVKKKGLTNEFIFEGHKPIEDMPKYTNIADILVGCLVKSELLEATIPAKVMSYIASGKPIVLAMDGEVKTLINDMIKCGFTGETENSQELAENILSIYNLSAKERDFMGSQAREYHFEHFERNLILSKLYSFMFQDSPV